MDLSYKKNPLKYQKNKKLACLMLIKIDMDDPKADSNELMKIENRKELITIRGIVTPVDWDEKGNVVATAISTHTEEEYLVINDSKGKELLNLIQEAVEVSGLVRELVGIKITTVKHITNWKINKGHELAKIKKKIY